MATEPQCPKATILLSDGSLAFRVRRGDGSEALITIDLLILKLCCEQCVDKHQLQVVDGCLPPTPEFLVDLAGRLQKFGIDGCTPSLAWPLWLAGIAQMEVLKKNMNETPTLPSGSGSIPEHSQPASDLDTLPISD